MRVINAILCTCEAKWSQADGEEDDEGGKAGDNERRIDEGFNTAGARGAQTGAQAGDLPQPAPWPTLYGDTGLPGVYLCMPDDRAAGFCDDYHPIHPRSAHRGIEVAEVVSVVLSGRGRVS